MGSHKRNASTFSAMEASSEATFSKKMKTTPPSPTTTCQLQLRSSDFHLRSSHLQHTTVSPAASANSAGTAVSGCYFSGGDVVKDKTASLDQEANIFETADSTFSDFKLFSKDKLSLLSEFSGDSEEETSTTTEFPAEKVVAPPKDEEIEEFFAKAEKYEQKRFAEKYNYDIVTDMPLEGRYQWVRSI